MPKFTAQREAAIVTPVPGTTRDVLEVSVDLGGVPVLVSDTAGLRESTDTVESIGIARARSAIESADLRLLVLSLPDVLDEGGQIKIPVEMQDFVADHPQDTFVLLNKTDLAPTPALLENMSTAGAWAVSLTEERGTGDFLQGLARTLRQRQVMLVFSLAGSAKTDTDLMYCKTHRTLKIHPLSRTHDIGSISRVHCVSWMRFLLMVRTVGYAASLSELKLAVLQDQTTW